MLPTIYQNYIHKSRYARWLEDAGRRETWQETVNRYINFFSEKPINPSELKELEQAILNLEVMPSMRCMMTAGPALQKDNVAGYNCAYTAIDNPRVFDEIMYILMCGTGVGFSVERRNVEKLPQIADEFHSTDTTLQVHDSKIGWAKAYRQLIALLYSGSIPKYDLSKIRPAGSPLKTFGGRASGPDPLDQLFRFTIEIFKRAAGRRLTSLECHDIVCKIAEVVVCGGVRRSALLSLSNLTDERMRQAKMGNWFDTDVQRALANNSVAYTEKPDVNAFLQEWLALYQSKAGERGIFNRVACTKMAPERRQTDNIAWGTNPCSEIVLRSKQFCNLSEVVARPHDTEESLMRKIKLATLAGTLQSTLTDFRYLSAQWRTNTEEERLLGVSITGITDCPILSNSPGILEWLKKYAIQCNKEYAAQLGIPASAAITCVKPSGTVSQLVDSSSGLHPRYAPYYIRRVRADNKDPLCRTLIEANVPWEQSKTNPNEIIFSFPMKAPDNAVCVKDVNAETQLELWKKWALEFCEHKPSLTVYVKEDEWINTAAWVYANFDIVNGISFFPHNDHIYPQAPYEEITKEEYEKLSSQFPKSIDFDSIPETNDLTTASQELACIGGACEL
jgi:ribonucleoside-diphosphate reductase alpha chain